MKASHTIRLAFDDPNLVSAAGLVPALRLAESAGLHRLLDESLRVGSPNATAKATSVVGGIGRLFAGVRAPSTLGTFLRSFTHGNVQQLDAVT